ncbi:hypothetical protein BDV10DRAFT_156508 [Aspergillus recurvatus]
MLLAARSTAGSLFQRICRRYTVGYGRKMAQVEEDRLKHPYKPCPSGLPSGLLWSPRRLAGAGAQQATPARQLNMTHDVNR